MNFSARKFNEVSNYSDFSSNNFNSNTFKNKNKVPKFISNSNNNNNNTCNTFFNSKNMPISNRLKNQDNSNYIYFNSSNKDYRYINKYKAPKDYNTQIGNKYMREAISSGKNKLNSKLQKNNSPVRSYRYSNQPYIKRNIKYNNYNKSTDKINVYPNKNYLNIANINKSYNNCKDVNYNNTDANSYKINHKKTSSNEIISDLIDNKFNVNSPSKYKINQQEIDNLEKNYYSKLHDNFKNTINFINSPDPNDSIIKNNGEKYGIYNSSSINDQILKTSSSLFNNNNNNNNIEYENYKSKTDKILIKDKNNNLNLNLAFYGSSPYEKYVESLEAAINCINSEQNGLIYNENLNNNNAINNNNNEEEKKSKDTNNDNNINCFLSMSIEDKINVLINKTKDKRRLVRLGSLVALYIIMKKEYILEESFKVNILNNTMNLIYNYEIQEELFLVACLELVSLFTISNTFNKDSNNNNNNNNNLSQEYTNDLNLKIINNLEFIVMFISDFNFPRLQKACFNLIVKTGFEGLKLLVNICTKDYLEYQPYILNSLIKTPYIQKLVIARGFLISNDIYSPNSKIRHSALASLNRMYNIVDDDFILFENLANFYKEPNTNKLEKIFLSSVFRFSGIRGELFLVNKLHEDIDYTIKIAIISVLAYRIPRYPNYLNVNLDLYNSKSIINKLPGEFSEYKGKVVPIIYENNTEICSKKEYTANTTDNPILEISSRDFIASLVRMINSIDKSLDNLYKNKTNNSYIDSDSYNITIKDFINPKLVYHGSENILDDLDVVINRKININTTNNSTYNYANNMLFFIVNNNLNSEENNSVNEDGYYYITKDAVASIINCLKNYSAAVRDAACSALGQISLPEAASSIPGLIEIIKREIDVNVKSKAIWAIGRLAPACDNYVISILDQCLKLNLMWKIKAPVLYSISEFGNRASYICLKTLIKMLKDSAINKEMISQTIVRLGSEGEEELLKIVNSIEEKDNFKLRSSIYKSFSFINIYSKNNNNYKYKILSNKNIDFIIESLYNAASLDKNNIIRRSALMSLKILFDKSSDGQNIFSNDEIFYLKRKNLLPMFYQKLADKDSQVQHISIDFIKSLGPQGELMFIEGLTKDKNVSIRCMSAIGLAKIGVSTFRTLLVGLYDDNPNVRKVIENEILKNFKLECILSEYQNKSPFIQSLKFSIKDILEKKIYISNLFANFLEELLHMIEYSELENIKQAEYKQNVSNNYYKGTDEIIQVEPIDNVNVEIQDKSNIDSREVLIDNISYNKDRINEFKNHTYDIKSNTFNEKNNKDLKININEKSNEYNTNENLNDININPHQIKNYKNFKELLNCKYSNSTNNNNDYINYNTYNYKNNNVNKTFNKDYNLQNQIIEKNLNNNDSSFYQSKQYNNILNNNYEQPYELRDEN